MTALLATFLGSSDEPNRRGDLDGAAWRFILPGEVATVEWRWEGRGHARDLESFARRAAVLGVSDGTGEPSATGESVDLVVGAPRDSDGSAPTQVGIDFDGGETGCPLELRYVDDDLRGVAPLDHARARTVLSGHVGDDGPVARSLKQRVKRSPRRVRRTVAGSLRGVRPGPPDWLVRAAADSGADISDHEWALWCRGDFGSQKLVMFLVAPGDADPSIVVKIVRDPRFNDRLVNESNMLRAMERLSPEARGGAPSLLFHTTIWGSAVSAQTAVLGADLRPELLRRPELVGRVTTWLTEMATTTRTAVAADELRQCLGELLEQYDAAYVVPTATTAFLARQIELLVDTELHAVVQHGDPGPWNAVVTAQDAIAFLDWEAGEERGLPLWDLLYFLRSASLHGSSSRPWRSRRSLVRRDLIAGSTSGDRVAEQVRAYVEAIGLDRRAVEPLYHLCWVQRAVKEARRLAPEQRSRGTFHRLVLDGVQGRDQPGLRRITLRDDASGGAHRG